MLSFIFVIVRGLREWNRICAGFLSFVYTCIGIGDPIIKQDSINRGYPAIFCSCPKPGPRFQTLYLFSMFIAWNIHKHL